MGNDICFANVYALEELKIAEKYGYHEEVQEIKKEMEKRRREIYGIK